MILFTEHNIKKVNIPRRNISRWIKTVIERYNKRVGDIAIVFCSDEKLLQINIDYLAHNYYTDVITFNYSNEKKISGDILISIDTVKSNAVKYKVDFKEELYRVIIHGILHLCGVDDKTKSEEKEMRESENIALNLLNIGCSYG